MVPRLSGGCLCEAVRYVLTQRVRFNPYACHCTDCQRRTGSAFGVQLTALVEDVEFTGDMSEDGMCSRAAPWHRFLPVRAAFHACIRRMIGDLDCSTFGPVHWTPASI